MPIKSIPDNQGWSAGGYNFYVAEDGTLSKGRPGETPTQLTGSLPDGAIIGGVAYFNRPTKPTERSAGVPLVTRDRWYNTSDGTEWFWNGTYWLGLDSHFSSAYIAGLGTVVNGATSNTTASGFISGDIQGVFIESFSVQGNVQTTLNASNTWTITATAFRLPTPVDFLTVDLSNYWTAGNIRATTELQINQAITAETLGISEIRYACTKTGSPGAVAIYNLTTKYRLISL